MTRGPILFDLEGQEDARPDVAPVVTDSDTTSQGAAMQQVAAIATHRPSRLALWFWSLVLMLFGVMLSLAAWDYVTGLLDRSPVLGLVVTGLIGLILFILLIVALREFIAFRRLRRLDVIQADAARALAAQDLAQARLVLRAVTDLYEAREDTAWGRAELALRQGDLLDADGLLGLAETTLMAPLDARAAAEVAAAARQVALVTAVVPLALADLLTALSANLRMIRRIAEIYAGRSGTLGNWRLTRTVLTHLVATGAVAVGDDLIHSVAGGGVLSKLSRRFGEGVINGALTARVGVAAIEVCRPLPFRAQPKPQVSSLMGQALRGLFGK